jgi:cyclophilin family peptidyl-prolyl cis-trans isomerase
MTSNLFRRNILTLFSAWALTLGIGVMPSQSLAQDAPKVKIATNMGDIMVELYPDKAPKTVANFLQYVKDKHYNGTIFHRVIANFMVQSGGFTGVPISPANAKTGTVYAPIQLETTTQTGLSNTAGTIAMARQQALNTATNQFFINVVDNTFLNTSSGGYAAFGNVISGLNTTVQSIRNLQVQSDGSGEVSQPLTPPVINWAYQLK